jgi:hypothetical protein
MLFLSNGLLEVLDFTSFSRILLLPLKNMANMV